MNIQSLSPLKDQLFFSSQTVANLFPQDNLHNIKIRLTNAVKSGKLIRLLQNTYIFADNFSYLSDPLSYTAAVACSIKRPSYVSLDTVLNQYQVFTESHYGLTLVTTKSRSLSRSHRTTIYYRHLHTNLFTGYSTTYSGKWPYLIASKAKALFDWLYFYADQLPTNLNHFDIAEELRLNLDSISATDYAEMKKYTSLSNKSSRLLAIINNLEVYASHHS